MLNATDEYVVYLLIPTSNHNDFLAIILAKSLYIF